MKTLRVVSLVLFLVAAVACSGSDGASPSVTTAPPPVSPVSSAPETTTTPVLPPSPPASAPATKGETTTSCVSGWVTPPKDSPRYLQPLGIIRRTSGVQGPLVVMDMRYFTGPESPPSDAGYLLMIERWYVKLYAKDDPAFQGRFLVEARRFGRGLSAVAAYDTSGWKSPDWIGFQFNSGDTTLKSYPGLPGEWEGMPYDFVKGGGGLDFPGVPAAVVGCLDGT